MFHSEQAPWHRLDEIFLRLKSKAKEIIRTITGNLPLIVPEAVASAIRSLTRYGLCTQAGTPTPSAPVDIMCNNGAPKWDSVNQQVYADGTPEVLTVSGANLLNPATNITGKYLTDGGTPANAYDAQYTDLIPVKEGETYVCSLVSGRNSGAERLHGYDSGGVWVKMIASLSASGKQGSKLAMAATIDSGISYVRLSYGINDTEAMICLAYSQISADGYYMGTQVSGTVTTSKNAPIQSPYTSANKFNGPAIVFSVFPGRMYAVKSNAVTNYTAIRFACYNNIEDINNNSKAVSRGEGAAFVAPNDANYAVVVYVNNASGTTFTFDEQYVSEMDADYQPYVAPQTASVPMLLSVGDYKDTQEIISGLVNRKCGIAALDGDNIKATGSDVMDGSYRRFYGFTLPSQMASNGVILCSHYRNTMDSPASYGIRNVFGGCQIYDNSFIDLPDRDAAVAAFNSFLASEYAKGTPVIIVYLLAEPTTESITPQELTLTEGTNIIDATANVEPLTAKCKYQAVSALDILSALLGTRSGTEDMSIKDAKGIVNVILGDDNK